MNEDRKFPRQRWIIQTDSYVVACEETRQQNDAADAPDAQKNRASAVRQVQVHKRQ